MSQVINGNELKNGNFLIELTAEQLNDITTNYLTASCRWQLKVEEAKNVMDKEIAQIIADEYFDTYKAFKKMQGKEI
jgi:hypothetical protein